MVSEHECNMCTDGAIYQHHSKMDDVMLKEIERVLVAIVGARELSGPNTNAFKKGNSNVD